jgi:hypothetical protein
MGFRNKKDSFGRVPDYKTLVGTNHLSSASFAGIAIPQAAGYGIGLGVDNPVLGWKDLLGQLIPRTTGAGTPTATAFRGQGVQYAFAANDVIDINYHIPHDYLPNSDIYLHVHWGHNGTNISGSLELTHYATYSKGHDQAGFPAEITAVQTITASSLGMVPQYHHEIQEFQLSSVSPTSTQLQTSDLEPDGLILLRTKATGIPTITGGAAKPFIFFIDMHYQSTNMTTIDKAPPFWG